MTKQTFKAGGKTETLYAGDEAGRPLIILNNYSGDGASVVEALNDISAPDGNLLVIGDLTWDHDMTPWYCPPIAANDTPCTGGADEYLAVLLDEILPEALSKISGTPPFIGIAGYSLGGLFALYASYRCDVFARVASMSGSLWFPDFKDYVMTHEQPRRPDRLYISLGNKEASTGNRFLKTVQTNTEAIVAHYRELGLDVTWELNPGNHFKDGALRSAKGIKALLEE